MITEVNVYETEKDVGGHMVALILAIAADAIKNKDSFFLGLSGGSAAKLFCENVLKHTSDWSKWNIVFCDERFVDHDDPESTYGYFKRHFFDKVAIGEDKIIKINFSHLNVDDAAKEYEKNMKIMFGNGNHLPEIDVLLLGFGPDGHTCSLFPNHKLLEETSRWVGFLSDSPKPPPSRITLTYPVINSAAHVIFVACGQSKSDIVKKIMKGPSKDVPASLVSPKMGSVHWFLDKAAGGQIETSLKQSQEL